MSGIQKSHLGVIALPDPHCCAAKFVRCAKIGLVFFFLWIFGSANAAEDRISPIELLEMIETEDGGFEAASIFGGCAGLFDALGAHFENQFEQNTAASSMADTFKGLARGAVLTGTLLAGVHSGNAQSTVANIAGSQRSYWAGLVAVAGLQDTAVAEEMAYCASFNDIQAETIEAFRKESYGLGE